MTDELRDTHSKAGKPPSSGEQRRDSLLQPKPESAPASLTVDLRYVIYALSDALDLVGIDDVGHGKRVGTMAAACGQAMGLDRNATLFLFDLGVLHDIGVSSTNTHNHLVNEFDWKGSELHCKVGHRLLKNFAPLAPMALPIRYHHTRWDELQKLPELDPKVAEHANLIFLVDRVDALASKHYSDSSSLLMHTDRIRDSIKNKAGKYFAPSLVDAFLRASSTEAFWLQLDNRGIRAVMLDMLEIHQPYQASIAEIKQLAEIFGRIVDAKSPFTAEHSLGVARLARFIAERMEMDANVCDKIEIAGLLHDLGKLRVPDEILDKPGELDTRERKVINTHSFETFQILHRIKGFEDITAWAAYHHEEPDGSGYPFHFEDSELPLEARILRVCDIFQAMVQDRPYRKGLSAHAVLVFLHNLADKGSIDKKIVDICASDMPAAMAAAQPGKQLLDIVDGWENE